MTALRAWAGYALRFAVNLAVLVIVIPLAAGWLFVGWIAAAVQSWIE